MLTVPKMGNASIETWQFVVGIDEALRTQVEALRQTRW